MLVEVYDLSALAAEMLYLSIGWATQGASLFWYHVQDAVVKFVSALPRTNLVIQGFCNSVEKKTSNLAEGMRLGGADENSTTHCPFRDY